jgi:glycosyltransferase involved in cell wall biosynthesis
VGTLTSDNPDADRKNLVNTIRWFLHAFRNKKDVGLIVKTSKGRDTTIDRQLVRTLMKQIKDTSNTKDYPKLYMLHGSMTREEMTDLYKSKKLCGFVSATRGEGFGLPLLEAAVSGLPIVAPDWSAHTEFLAGPSFLRVLCDIKPVDASRVDGKIFIKNALWANPREGNYKRKLKVALDKNEQLKKSASILADKLKNTHSLDAIFSHYQRVVSEHL